MGSFKSRELIDILKDHNLLSDSGKIEDLSRDQLLECLSSIDNQFQNFEQQAQVDNHYKLIFDKVPCTISLVDQNLNYVYVNETLAKICGLEVKDFIGNKVGFFTRNKFFFKYVRKLFLAQDQILGEEIEETIQEGEKVFWISGTIIPESNQALVIGIDITDVRNLEGRLEFTEKLTALGEVMAGMIHDINNPLAVIHSCGSIIAKQPLDDEKRVKWGNKIIQTSTKISNIVNSVKTYVRNAEDDPFEDFDIHDVYFEALDICGPKLHNCEVTIRPNEGEGKFIVNGNRTKIFQVLTNLISNSCDALMSDIPASERWIEVSYEQTSENNIIYIKDAGNGIPEEIQKDIFKAFYTTKDVGVGSGLGLSTCQKILKEHKGIIEIDDSSENTCFKINLPKAS